MKYLKRSISILIIILSSLIISLCLFVKKEFSEASFEQILYNIVYSKGTGGNVVLSGIKFCIPIFLIMTLLLSIPVFKHPKKIRWFNKIYLPFIMICTVVYAISSLGISEYIDSQKEYSTLFEDYYIDPKKTEITFPEKKKNLIYIYLESMEATYTKTIIDGEIVNLIPNLEKIAKDNISFSDSDSLGGPVFSTLTHWTAAGLVAQMGGIPIKTPMFQNTYGKESSFLPGATMLGEILEKEGYKNYYLIGSDAKFASRDNLFKTHGDYEINDYNWAKSKNLIPKDYVEFWGYEDKKLFAIAKKRLLEIAKNDEPFNFTMLTVDTHAIDGYLDKSCPKTYDYKYGNVIKCSDSMVSSFVQWLQKQEFYEDTVVILSGDHLTMQTDITKHFSYNQKRTGYNAILNTDVVPKKTNDRVYTTMDMFPTTLAALGANIKGERLGLGTNLFSNEKTLAEQIGINDLNQELSKNSKYYNAILLGGEYYDLVEKEKQRKKK